MEYNREINDFLTNLIVSSGENAIDELKKITPFSLCLKIFRTKKNISQKELATSIGISENSIYNYENGKSNPTKNNKSKIMDFLEIPTEALEFCERRILLNRSKLELSKKYNENNENIINRIKKEISTLDSSPINSITYGENLFRCIILPMILKKKEFSLKDLENSILGFKMLNANNNYRIEMAFPDFINGYEGWKVLLVDKRNDLICKEYEIIEFADKVLIPISEKIDSIFNDSVKESEREINKKSVELSEQYEKLYDFWNNISSEIDLKQSKEREIMKQFENKGDE